MEIHEMMEKFYISTIRNSGHKPSTAIEHFEIWLKNQGTKLQNLFDLLNLNLNNNIWLVPVIVQNRSKT